MLAAHRQLQVQALEAGDRVVPAEERHRHFRECGGDVAAAAGVAGLAERDHVVAVGEIIAALGECLAPVLDAYRGLHLPTANLDQFTCRLGVDSFPSAFVCSPVFAPHLVATSLSSLPLTSTPLYPIRSSH